MRVFFLLVPLVLLLAGSVRADLPPGAPFIRRFTPEEMGGGPQFFGLAISADGLVYAGGQSGLLEFDGQEWRNVSGNLGYMAAVATDDAGRLHVGGIAQLLRLEPSPVGGWAPKDMLQPLGLKRAGASPFFFVQQDPRDRSLWFSAINRLVRVDAKGVAHVVREGGGVARLILWGDQLLLRTVSPGGAMFWAREGKLELVPPELAAALDGINAAVQFEHQRQLAFRAREFRAFEGSKPLSEWRPVPGLEAENSILCALRLDDHRVVVGTQRGAAIVLGRDGEILDRWTEADGLPGGSIRVMRRDGQGGLWMATDSGLARVEIESRFRRFAPERGLKSPLLTLHRHFGRLWAGSPAGVMRENEEGIFERQPKLPAAVWGFRSDGEDLIVAGGSLLVVRPDGSTEKVSTPPSFAAIGDPEIDSSGQILLVPSSGALLQYRRDAGWQFERSLPGFTGSAFDLIFAPDGTLWLADARTRVFRWPWRPGEGPVGEPIEVPLQVPTHLPAEMRLAVWRGSVWVASNAGLHRWDAAAGRLVRADELGSFASRRLTAIASPPDGKLWLLAGIGSGAEQSNRIWCISKSDRPTSETYVVEEFSIGPLAPKTVYGMHVDVGGIAYLFGEGPLSVLESRRDRGTVANAPVCRIRRVSAEQSTVFEGGSRESAPLALPLGQRSARFEYAAVWFSTDSLGRSPLVFRSRLKGSDSTWSPWSAERRRDYTNLSPGSYVFEAQAGQGEEATGGPVASFVFLVPAYWWETVGARLGLGLALAAAIALTARSVAQRRLKQRVLFLERTAEVQTERLRIARDMHDEIGSSLAHIAVTAQRLSAQIPEPRIRAQAQHIRTIASEVMNSVRDIIWSVNPQDDTLDSLANYLANWVHRSFGDAGIECSLDVPTDLPEVDVTGPVRNAVFLATKEAVQNSIKHSGTKRARYAIRMESGVLVCTLTDEGTWNEPETRQPGSGVGLHSLQARLSAVGGETRVDHQTGGTVVTIRLPLRPSRSG